MGSFDTMTDGKQEIQVKCFSCDLKRIHKGEKVPILHNYHERYKPWDESDQLEKYTIVMTPYSQPRFALVKKGIFVRFTEDENQTYEPYVHRSGFICDLHGNELSVNKHKKRTND